MKILFVLSAILAISQQKYIEKANLTPFGLDDFFNGTFVAKSWNATWITDSAVIYINNETDIIKFEVSTKSTELFLGKEILEKHTGSSIKISDDLKYVLITYNVSSVFRHSTTAQFAIYDIDNKIFYDIANGEPLQLVSFAPAGHGLVYVKDNDIYYLDNFAQDIQNPIRITTWGIPGIVYCGVPDWVYEEEVLASGSALWFSPDAKYLAFAVFDDKGVTEFSYAVYDGPGNLDYQYPHEAKIRYPKVGTPNPLVSVYLYSIEYDSTTEYQLPVTVRNKEPNDYILYGLKWITDKEVVMISTNRVQNESTLVRCQLDGTCIQEGGYKETNGWIEPQLPQYSKDGTKRLEILPQPVDDDEYNQLVLTNLQTNSVTRLVNGRVTVTAIDGWNENSGLIYYTATIEDTPSQKHVYSIDETGTYKKCITCELVVDGEPCYVGSVSFSPNFTYQVRACNGPSPYYYQIENINNENDVFVWQDNVDLRKNLTFKTQPLIKNLLVPVKNNFTARVRLLVPPSFDETSDRKYPAVVYTYGGPNTNQINDQYSRGFESYIVTKREYIWILIDGRGSGNDGHNKMFQMYRNFGTVEIEDQISVTKYLQQTLPYIDASRTGIWGWSYGGFCSSWVLAQDAEKVFLFALSVAPVTNFILYDTIYTERYMGLLADNEAGYNRTDLRNSVETIRGRNYFVIHGSGDDNVHYQNSMLWIKALEVADIPFRQNTYPDENHNLGGVTKHLYHMIDRYWAEQFGIEKSSEELWRAKEH